MQLICCRASRIDIVCRQEDLDGRSENAGPGEGILRFLEGAPDGCVRDLDLALREAEQRKPWVRIDAELARLPIRRLGVGEPTAQTVEIADASVGAADDRRRRVTEIADSSRLVERIVPVPTELEDLGTVQQALTAVEHEMRVPVAPVAQDGSPVGDAPDVEELVTRIDHCAVDVTHRDRGDVLATTDTIASSRRATPPEMSPE